MKYATVWMRFRMNWKEFKDTVESQGVTDDMKLYRIEVDSEQMTDGEIEVLMGIGLSVGVAII